MSNSFKWNYCPVKRNSNMRPWELLLRNANVLQSVLEKAEPELSLLELDARRLFILCTVEANAFPAEAEYNFPDQETRRERLLTAAGGKR